MEPTLESALAMANTTSSLIDRTAALRPQSNGTFTDFLLEFPKTVWSIYPGKVLLCLWGSGPFLGIFLYLRKKQAEKAAKKR
jgi:hypothetical protein